MGRRTVSLLVVGLSLLLAVPALGQGKGRRGKARGARAELKAEVEALAKKVDQALAARAGATAEGAKLEALRQELAQVKAELARIRAQQAAQATLNQQAAATGSKLAATRQELSGVKASLSALGLKAGYRNGFYIRNLDDRFQLRLRGFIQGAYQAQIFSDALIVGGQDLADLRSEFVLRRARPAFEGHLFSPHLKFNLEMGFGAQEPATLIHAWGELDLFRFLRLRVGKQKIPQSRQFMVPLPYLQMSDRSSVTRTFMPGWDIGASLAGDIDILGVLSYQAGIFNGAGSMAGQDNNSDFLYAARLVYQPLGAIPLREGDREKGAFKVAVGGSFLANLAPTDLPERLGITEETLAAPKRDLDGSNTVDNVWIYQAAAELTARLKVLLWQSEFFYRIEDPGAAGDDRTFWGVYSQLGTVPQLGIWDMAVRYGFMKPHYYGLLRTTPRPEQLHEVTGSLSIFTWNRRLRWIAEYTYQYQKELFSEKDGVRTVHLPSQNMHQVRVQAQVYF